MNYIAKTLKKYFLLALKSNRCFNRIDSLDWKEGKPIKRWIKGLDFPVLLHRQIFTNKDGSTGILYLISNDLNLTTTKMETIYQKRWSVEVFHKNIKSNTALAKSPTSTIRTQSNHVFISIYASAVKNAFFQLRELNLA